MSSSQEDVKYNILESNDPRYIAKLKQEKEKALKLYEAGHTRVELYQQTDLSMTEIRELLKDYKPQKCVKKSPAIVTLMKKTILEYHNRGYTIETIMEKTGYSRSGVHSIIRENQKMRDII